MIGAEDGSSFISMGLDSIHDLWSLRSLCTVLDHIHGSGWQIADEARQNNIYLSSLPNASSKLSENHLQIRSTVQQIGPPLLVVNLHQPRLPRLASPSFLAE